MTIEDVDWLLRYPCDEIAMSQESLARVNAAIGSSKTLAEGVVYRNATDATGRATRIPHTLGGKKLTVIPDTGTGGIVLSVKGLAMAKVVFFA